MFTSRSLVHVRKITNYSYVLNEYAQSETYNAVCSLLENVWEKKAPSPQAKRHYRYHGITALYIYRPHGIAVKFDPSPR